ncbi:MAG: OsmC family peroxiredoxin [Bacteroidetes bacterium]|nr:MAG: OsmC family peroxiredoxin [Bacteroidota bacterium]
MKEAIQIRWLNGLSFEADVDGHKLYLDAKAENGGKNMGPRPKQLLMVSLAGCTGMDVASILQKMKEEVEEIVVEVEGDLAEEHPKKYESLKVIFRIRGKNISRKNVEKAVELSTTKYCGVSATLEKAVSLSHEIIIEES